MTDIDTQPLHLVVISAGTGDPSSTRTLADRLAIAVRDELAAESSSAPVTIRVIDVRDLATDVARAVSTGWISAPVREALDTVATADALIAATPVYKAGYSGLFKAFVDLFDDDSLLGTPVILAATAGTPRHSLVPDTMMRPLFAYLRAVAVPTSVFAATEDWAHPRSLDKRIRRAAGELADAIRGGLRARARAHVSSYSTELNTGTLADASDPAAGIDFDTDLMRLATGGARPADAHGGSADA